MKKFTIFTVILTIVVVVVFAELMSKGNLSGLGGSSGVATDQSGDNMKLTLPKSLDAKKSLKTDVLGSDGSDTGTTAGDLANRLGADNQVVPRASVDSVPVVLPETSKNPDFLDPNAFVNGAQPVDVTNLGKKTVAIQAPPPTGQAPAQTSDVKDFEDADFAAAPTGNVYLRDEQIKSAGFTGGYLENEPLDGRLFKTIDISDLSDVEVTKTDIRSKEEILAKVYVFKIGLNNNVSEVYQILKMRAAQGPNIKLNETNEFGQASFYMNDPSRSDTAFL
ncbi:hypothetical protein HZA40_01275, partial [Candidatus Peregrinibacteria bacterium]|nr:hypothetical protein [Candidatus Peregrinibacteria bacterium]